MKVKALSLSVVAALSLGLAANANAAEMVAAQSTTVAPVVNNSGFYVGANVGMINSNNHVNPGIAGARRSAQAVKVEAGYNFNKNVAVYTSYDYGNKIQAGAGEDAQLSMGTVGVKGSYYLTNNLSLFGKVGVAYVHAIQKGDALKHDTAAGTVGAGVSYQLTNAVSTQVGYDYYRDAIANHANTKKSDLNEVYWGMTYKFGQPATPRVITREVTVEVVKQVPVNVATATGHIVAFANGSAKLSETSRFTLVQVINTMKAHPALNAQLIGRTSATGPAALNAKLSAERANAVAQFLEANGVAAARLHVQSVANSSPLAQNAPALERSVQIVLK